MQQLAAARHAVWRLLEIDNADGRRSKSWSTADGVPEAPSNDPVFFDRFHEDPRQIGTTGIEGGVQRNHASGSRPRGASARSPDPGTSTCAPISPIVAAASPHAPSRASSRVIRLRPPVSSSMADSGRAFLIGLHRARAGVLHRHARRAARTVKAAIRQALIGVINAAGEEQLTQVTASGRRRVRTGSTPKVFFDPVVRGTVQFIFYRDLIIRGVMVPQPDHGIPTA